MNRQTRHFWNFHSPPLYYRTIRPRFLTSASFPKSGSVVERELRGIKDVVLEENLVDPARKVVKTRETESDPADSIWGSVMWLESLTGGWFRCRCRHERMGERWRNCGRRDPAYHSWNAGEERIYNEILTDQCWKMHWISCSGILRHVDSITHLATYGVE